MGYSIDSDGKIIDTDGKPASGLEITAKNTSPKKETVARQKD